MAHHPHYDAFDLRVRLDPARGLCAWAACCVWALLACGGGKAPRDNRDDAGAAPAAEAGPRPCGSHKECVDAHAAHWICRSDHTCVSLLSETCTFVRGDDTREDAVFVGVLSAPRSPALGVSELVREDFTAAVGGLPGAGRAKPRPFVLVGCEYPIRTDPLPAARHLIDTIGVPAIVGPLSSTDVINVAQNLAVPAGALVMSPFAQSDLISDLPDDDLVFRTTATSSAIAPQLAAMLAEVEVEVRAESAPENVKVAIISARDAYGIALSTATARLLRFNGRLTTDENEQRGHFLAVSYDATEEDFADVVAERVVAFGPHVVLSLTATEVRPFQAVEEALASSAQGSPQYVIDAAGLSLDHVRFVASRPDALRRRIRIASTQDPTRALNAEYVARIERDFGSSANLLAGGTTYDGMLAVALAITAAPEGPLTGRAIARGLRRLVGPGTTIEVRPDQIARAVMLLGTGEVIQLEGISGPLDFDARGDVTSDGSVSCYVRDTATDAVSVVFSGQLYRAATGKLEGTRSECD